MAIVWVCRLGVDAYAELCRQLDVPRFECPLRPAHGPLGFYRRYLRVGIWCRRVWIRRQRCRACRRSHVVLPQFVTNGRLDEVGVIGEGTEAMVAGRGARKVAADLGLPHTTVRDWRRRFRSRAVLLAMGVAAAVVALAGTLPRLSADPEQAALQAMAAAGPSLPPAGQSSAAPSASPMRSAAATCSPPTCNRPGQCFDQAVGLRSKPPSERPKEVH